MLVVRKTWQYTEGLAALSQAPSLRGVCVSVSRREKERAGPMLAGVGSTRERGVPPPAWNLQPSHSVWGERREVQRPAQGTLPLPASRHMTATAPAPPPPPFPCPPPPRNAHPPGRGGGGALVAKAAARLAAAHVRESKSASLSPWHGRSVQDIVWGMAPHPPPSPASHTPAPLTWLGAGSRGSRQRGAGRPGTHHRSVWARIPVCSRQACRGCTGLPCRPTLWRAGGRDASARPKAMSPLPRPLPSPGRLRGHMPGRQAGH